MTSFYEEYERRQAKSRNSTKAQAERGDKVEIERIAMHRELRHTYRKLTKKEIAAQYPPEKVEQLMTKAAENMRTLLAPRMGPGWLDREE